MVFPTQTCPGSSPFDGYFSSPPVYMPQIDDLAITSTTEPDVPVSHWDTNPDFDLKKDEATEELSNGGYGWVCVACSFLINAHTWGINASFGVFLADYIANDVFPGASRLDYAFVSGLSFSMSMLISPVATIAVGKFGTRPCLCFGTALETLGLICASFAKEYWQLLLSQGVCFGLGMGFLYVGIAGIVSQWFTSKRSLANGIASSGSGLGGLIYNLAAAAMIQRLGLEWTFRILGIVSGSTNLISALLIRDRNEHIGTSQLPFDLRILRRPEFILLQAYGFFTELGYVVLLFSLPNFANSIGLNAQQGSLIGALICISSMFGRWLAGYLGDRIGPITVTCVFTFFTGVFALVIWPFATNYGLLIFFSLLSGLTVGTYWATIAPICAEVVGMKDLNTGLSMSFFNLVLPLTFSEATALEITGSTGSYLGAQLFAGFTYIVGAVFLWFLKAWKVGELERKAELSRLSTNDKKIIGGEEMKYTGRSSYMTRLIVWRRV